MGLSCDRLRLFVVPSEAPAPVEPELSEEEEDEDRQFSLLVVGEAIWCTHECPSTADLRDLTLDVRKMPCLLVLL